jgi:dTDP-4-amino-4,6-dideoxygalactose transaminase
VERCGYAPYLVDIDSASSMDSLERLLDHGMLSRTGVVVPVTPNGRAPDQIRSQDFLCRTGVPVVIDAAAAFEAVIADPGQTAGLAPIALSFRATKTFSAVEGGAVVWSDPEGLDRVMSALNFGFRRLRDSENSGGNGKMSE